jgi:hypothetical protein
MQGAAKKCKKDTIAFQKAKGFPRTWTKDGTNAALGLGHGKRMLFAGFEGFLKLF